MKKLITVVFICALTLLFSGCGSLGFTIGVQYNEWGISVDVKGATPTEADLTTVEIPTVHQ